MDARIIREYSQNLQLLYVEDDEEIRKANLTLFKNFFKKIIIAVDGEDGYEKFQNNQVDIIITDINMPKLNGIDMIAKIRDTDNDIPIIIVSAHNEAKYFIGSIKLGVDGYLLKPIGMKQFLSVLYKITKKIKLSQDLKSALLLSQQYQNATDKSSIVSKTDLKGIITYVNEAFCKISGYTKEELLGQPHNIIRGPMPAATYKELWDTIQSKNIWQGEVQNKKKDGTFYWIDATVIPILDEDNEIQEYLSIRHDITERMNHKISLENTVTQKRSEIIKQMHLLKEYKNAIEVSTILSTTNIKGLITSANEEFCRISQFTQKELLGKSHNMVRDPDEAKEVYAEMWKTILDKRIWKGILKNKAKDGSVYWVYSIIVPILDEKHNILEFLGIRQNITELVTYRLALEERVIQEVEKNREKDLFIQTQSAQAAVGEMINSIAHQWRQPLNIINLEAANISFEAKSNGEYKDIESSASKIIQLTRSMSQTITDFMEFSKPSQEIEKFFLEKTFNSIQQMLESQLFSKNIKFINNCNPIITLQTYENYLKEVIINIISNAKDASSDEIKIQKTIKIDAQETNGFVFITIADNAGGIPETAQNKIFEPYFTTKEKGKGTGLGLSICKKITKEQLLGEISFTTDTLGTKFTLKIQKIRKL